MAVDAAVGRVTAVLQETGLAQDTLLIFTSDNGCSPQADFAALRAKGLDPSAGFRGTKADIFEGGHRVPFIARWPGKIQAGSTSDRLICLNDLLATCAGILGTKLPDNAGEDSLSILPALFGKAGLPLREALVHHSVNGSFAIREKNWKLVLCPDSGGWSAPRPGSAESRRLPAVQLYDLARDRGETTNLQASHTEIVARLTSLLEKYVADGRSTAGARQPNTGNIQIWQQRPASLKSKTPKDK
jgi:arylsulfatase A-like enzyme